ncbi:MAG TPA: hypothetical protein VIQ03_11585 [Gammaproteobacteria bacterium]
MNNRRPEASSLRAFFQDQLEQLRQLVDNHHNQKLKQLEEKENLHNAIETLVEGTDSRIRGIGSYQKQLRDSASKLLNHINGLVDNMPPPVAVNKTTLVTDPLVKAFFGNREIMQDVFSQNAEVQAFFNAPENSDKKEVFVLMYITRREKSILGAELKNDLLLKEVKQTHVSFYDHRLAAPTATEADARLAMKRNLFECVVTHLKKHITELRHSMSEDEKIKIALNPEQNLNNPEVYIKMLAQRLSLPTELIKLHDHVIRLNKMGIKLPLDDTNSSDLLEMQALEVGDMCCQVISIVRYPRDELLPAKSGFI